MAGRLPQSVSAVGFWTGTLLPFVYLPLFVVGVDSVDQFALFLALLALNAVALVVGHDYRRGDRPSTR